MSLIEILMEWILKLRTGTPQLIGMNGPQGCGKTTLTSQLVGALSQSGVKAISLSIDDFYLTRQEQIQLAGQYPQNPFLQQRGYPGTHDIELGQRTLKALKELVGNETVTCPVYDKSKFQGKGDRLNESCWKQIQGPLDFILFEGWMLGFAPVPESGLSRSMKEINHLLKGYQSWYEQLDGLIQLVPQDISFVVDWRAEAEARMRAEGRDGMEPGEVREYIEKFLPAYEIYLPNLLANPPVEKNRIQLTLSKNRTLQ